MEDKKKRDVERPLPEYTFNEGTLNQFFSNLVWKTISELLEAQEQVALLHLASPDVDDIRDVMFWKGVLNQLQYMKNIKLTLLEE